MHRSVMFRAAIPVAASLRPGPARRTLGPRARRLGTSAPRAGILLPLLAAGLGTTTLCAGDVPILPETPYEYADVTLPEHFLVGGPPGPPSVISTDNTPPDNQVTDAGATLGRVLFYDRTLSANATTACASCHAPENGFSDPNVHSIGFGGETTRRHSMGLSNARFYARGHFFWDERAATLESQVLMPFQDPVEMGLTLDELEAKIAARAFYAPLFEAAFGDATVSADRIARSLAQFVRSLLSYTSKYDTGRALVQNPGQPFPNFTPQENTGKQLFLTPPPGGFGCAGCHATEAFITGPVGPTNNGLDAVSTDDLGVFETTGLPQHLGAFKVTSLRNVAVTAPYMHDGRMATLDDVLEHYSTGVQPHVNLHPLLRNPDGTPRRLNMTPGQKAALLAFFDTLTDESMLADVRFSDPFVPCPSDANGDAVVGFDDLLAVLSSWGACDGCAGDVDGDGFVTFSDLVTVLSAWGPCGG